MLTKNTNIGRPKCDKTPIANIFWIWVHICRSLTISFPAFQYQAFCTTTVPRLIRSSATIHTKWVGSNLEEFLKDKKQTRRHLQITVAVTMFYYVYCAGYEPLAPPPPPTATAVPVWQDRTIASSKLRMLEYSAFMEVQRDPDNVS